MSNIVLGADGIMARQNIFQEDITQKNDLGRKIDFSDGRRFRYCKASGAVEIGHLVTTAAVVANDADVTQTGCTVTISGGSIGSKVIDVLLGAATTKDLYADGYFNVVSGTGLGQFRKIKSNSAGGSAVGSLCTVTLYDPLITALDATSVITLCKNKYKDVVQGVATTVVGSPIGVPLIAVTTGGYYFWAQTRGLAPVMVDDDGNLVIGEDVVMGGGDAGAIITCADASLSKRLGVAVHIADEDMYAIIDLHCE